MDVEQLTDIDMKNLRYIISFAMSALLSFSMVSCTEKSEVEVALEVNYNNISAVWKIEKWNGAPLAEGSWCYLQLERKDHKFKLYQKMDSMYARLITGTYTITTDPYLGDVISGKYDFGRGEWSHKYVVSNLMPSGTMLWTAEDNASDVTLYRKCDAVPQDVLDECVE